MIDNTHLPCSLHCNGCVDAKCAMGYDEAYKAGSDCIDCWETLPEVDPLPLLPLCPVCLERYKVKGVT